jgi:hypothetical protein
VALSGRADPALALESVLMWNKRVSKTIAPTRDLPLDESRVLAGVMLRLHADFRRRHDLPPLPTAWTLLDDMRSLGARATLVDPALLESRASRLVTRGRRVLWTILKPLFYRQTEVNRDVVLALEALAREREQNRHAQFVLAERVAELEAEVARLKG